MSGSSSMSNVEGKFKRKNPVTAAALHLSDKTAVSSVYCKQQHRSNKCQVVTNVASRRGILRKKGVCFVPAFRPHCKKLFIEYEMFEMSQGPPY